MRPYRTRRMCKAAAGLMAIALFAAIDVAYSQVPEDSTLVADSVRARQVLAQGLAALGGADHLRALVTWDVQGTGRENLSAEAQGLAPDRPTWRDHSERVAIDARTLTVAWQRKTPRNDFSLRWRRFIYGPDSTGFFDFNSGYGGFRATSTPESFRRSLVRRVPQLLLLEAATTARSAAWRGEQWADGETLDVIDAEMSDGARLTLLFARSPVVLRGVEYRTDLPTRGDVTVVWRWEGWRPDRVAGLVPAAHRVEIDGVPFQEVAYSRFAADAAVEEMFSIPEREHLGAVDSPVPPAPGFDATGTVAPGVQVGVIDGFVVMVVEFEDFVVAVDAPEAHPGFEHIPAWRPAERVSRHYFDWVRGDARGKPIRYLVISHHHSDHMGGLRPFVAAGATLLVPAGDVEAARHALVAPHTIAADGLTGLADSARIEPVADRAVLRSAGRSLEVINVGANPHTDENLIVWLPDERILFQGDLFYYAEGAPFPPSGRSTMNAFLAGWLDAHGIEPLAVYGVHNRGAAGPAALARALAAE